MKLVLIILFLPLISFAQTSGRVVGVSDGDTITVLQDRTQIKVRLAGIDAPESSQAFGQRSKQNLSRLVYGKTVSVISKKTDRYGRAVGKVLINGTDANLEQIKAGFAWVYRNYLSELSAVDRKTYLAAEDAAKSAKLGLWSDPSPVPPWNFRSTPSKRHEAGPSNPAALTGMIKGNRNSKIFHEPNCRDYGKVSERNTVWFATPQEAAAAGYRRAKNCD